MSSPAAAAIARLRRSVRAAARLFGYELTRIAPAAAPTFYAVSPTCQIPTLAFLYELFFGRRHDGVFVEIGAFDGYTYSNTSCLADAGWRGCYIEPVPSSADACRQRHAGNPRIEVAQLAIGAAAGQMTLSIGGPLSTANAQVAAEYQRVGWARREFAANAGTVTVAKTTLDRFLDERGVPRRFDLLVVDVEGGETDVFDGFSLDRWRPRMMIVELADTHSELGATRDADARLSQRIRAAGYTIVYKDAINTMFVSDTALASTYRLGGADR